MHAVGFYLLFSGGAAVPALGVALLGISSGRCGWMMHEGGHYSLTGHIRADRAIQVVLGLGRIVALHHRSSNLYQVH